MVTKIKKYGNKYIAPIPNKLQNEHCLKEGDYLDLDFVDINQKNSNKPKLEIIIKRILKKHTT